jgi:hypothetical protein
VGDSVGEEMMIEKSSLRRFAELRRIRRLVKVSKQNKRDSIKTRRRVAMTVRTSVLPAVPARLKASGKVLHLSRPRLVGNILEWFAIQPELIQAIVAAW